MTKTDNILLKVLIVELQSKVYVLWIQILNHERLEQEGEEGKI